MARKNFITINTCLVVILLIVLIFNTYNVLQLKDAFKPKEAPRLPNVELTLIKVSDCENCLDVAQIAEFVKQAQINISKTTTIDESEAGELISRYALAKLPAAVIVGETQNLSIENFELRNDVLVFDQSPAPFFDTSTGAVKGMVDATIIADKTCKECSNLSLIVDQLKQSGVFISSKRTLDKDSAEGKKLVEKYKIEKVPTLIFNNEAMLYEIFQRVWNTVGSEENEGMLVMRQITPPYKDIESNTVKGLVVMTYVTDKSCSECYNATMLKQVMSSNFGMQVVKENNVDVSSGAGKKLVEKYKIELVPTAILSSDAGEYPSLEEVWEQVGTVESDGVYVFRNLALLEGQTYKNLTSKKVVAAE